MDSISFELLDAIPFFDNVKELLLDFGRDKAKDILNKVFSSEKDDFKQIVLKVVLKLDDDYNKELFGGRMTEVMTRPECLEIYKNYLYPFEEPSEASFAGLIDFNGLPPGFLNTFKRSLLLELLKSQKFRSDMIGVFASYKLESIERGIGEIREAVRSTKSDIDGLVAVTNNSRPTHGIQSDTREIHLLSLDNSRKLDTIIQLMTEDDTNVRKLEEDELRISNKRIGYELNREHIQRTVVRRDEQEDTVLGKADTVINSIKAHKQLILLSSAGMGKTAEIEYIAHYFSKIDHSLFPIRVDLNTYTDESIENIIGDAFEEWSSIPKEKLLLIFDGLDEVHGDYFEKVALGIINFSKRQALSSIVITCRDNFFNQSPFDGKTTFKVFRLKELSFSDIERFAKLKLEAKSKPFLAALKKQRLTDFCLSPFFLLALIDDFREQDSLPKSKHLIFEHLIDRRLNRDIVKFGNGNLKLGKHIVSIRKMLERLSLIMETLGRNYITEDELQTAITKYKSRQLIEHTFLFEMAKRNTWQFEHNNFQEYLAAKALSEESVEAIIDFITFSPDYRKIKPTWLNTVSFLFSILPSTDQSFDALLRVVIDNDREVLLRFEKDRIALSVREEVFRTILDEYHEKGRLARSDIFAGSDLARFVADSKKTIRHLIDQMRQGDHRFIDACRMLRYFNFIGEFRQEVQPILEGRILDRNTHVSLKYDCIQALVGLNWRDRASFDMLSKGLPPGDAMIGASVYTYLTSSGFQDEYVDLIIKHLGAYRRAGVRKNGVSTNVRPWNESDLIESCILSLRLEKSLRKVIIFFTRRVKSGRSGVPDSLLDGGFRRGILLRLEEFLSDDNKVLIKNVIDFYLTIYSIHGGRTYVDFFDLFRSTATLPKVCRILSRRGKKDSNALFSLGHVADETFLRSEIKSYQSGRLSNNDILTLRNVLSFANRKTVSDWFYEEIVKLSAEIFSYPVSRDSVAIKRARYETNMVSILDRRIFHEKVSRIFDLVGDDEFNVGNQWELDDPEEPGIQHSVEIEVMREFAKPTVERSIVAKWINNDKAWEWFQIGKLVEYDSHDAVELSSDAIEFTRNWCNKSLAEADFRNAVGNSKYGKLEIYLAYLIPRFNFKFPDNVYLDLLSVDSICLIPRVHNGDQDGDKFMLSEWVIEKVGLRRVSDRIIQNLSESVPSLTVRLHHFATCKRNGITEVLPFLEKELSDAKPDSHHIYGICDTYLSLGGNVSVVEKILTDRVLLTVDDQIRLIEILSPYAIGVAIAFMENELLSDGGDETNLKYAHELIKKGCVSGLNYYRDWIYRHKRFDDFISFRQFLSIPTDQLLPVALDIVCVYVTGDFNPDSLRGQNQDLLDGICNTASVSDYWYQVVRQSFTELSALPNAVILHYYINRLDTLHYSAKTITLEIRDACRFVDELKRTKDNQKTIIMAKYLITGGQQGNVGDNAHIHNLTQIQNDLSNEDLAKLVIELQRLRKEAKKEFDADQRDIEIGALASAEKAAKAGDKTKLFEHLKTAGKWTLDIAVKIGTALAASVLKGQLGIP